MNLKQTIWKSKLELRTKTKRSNHVHGTHSYTQSTQSPDFRDHIILTYLKVPNLQETQKYYNLQQNHIIIAIYGLYSNYQLMNPATIFEEWFS